MAAKMAGYKSVIPACDFREMDTLKKLVRETSDIDGISGYKVGAILVLRYGLPAAVETIRAVTNKVIIVDMQKAMTDIPDLGKDYVAEVKASGADALIGFPQSGPATQEAWIRQCNEQGLFVIMGGEMTHAKFKRSEGGYIADEAFDEMYTLSANLGVTQFVVPGNKLDRIAHYRALLQPIVKRVSSTVPVFYSPGLVTQGGEITEAAKAAGDFWHAIVGRAIFSAEDMRKAAELMVSQLRK